MSPLPATFICIAFIAMLFWLNKDSTQQTSWALWIPVIWLLVAGSRNISEWLQFSPPSAAGAAYLEGNPIDRNCLTGLMVLGAMVLFNRRTRISQTIRANPAIIMFFLYCAVSSLWSDFPDVAIKRWFRSMGDIIMVLVVITDGNVSVAIQRFLSRTGYVLLPMSVLFIRYYPNLGRAYGIWDSQPSWTGVTTSKNVLGMISLIFGLAAAWRVIESWSKETGSKRTRRIIANGTLFVIAVGLIKTADSMTSLGCLLMAGGVMVAISHPRVVRRTALVYSLVALVVLGSFSALFLHIGTGLVEGFGRDASLTGRDEIWAMVLSFAPNAVVGAGYESFWLGPRLLKIWSLHAQNFNQAHNGYIEIYLNLGWVGLIFLTGMIFSGMTRIVAAVGEEMRIGSLMLAYIIVGLTYNFTEAAFKMNHPAWILFLLSLAVLPTIRKRSLVPEMPVQFYGGARGAYGALQFGRQSS